MTSHRRHHPFQKGFTAMDLLISFVVLAILASLAYPAYTAHLRRAHRTTAKAILMETAQYLERYHATHQTYVGARVEAVSRVSPKTADESQVRYRIRFAEEPTASSFMLEAIPVHAQQADECGALSVSHLGEQGPQKATCW